MLRDAALRAQLRAVLLSDELLGLPDVVARIPGGLDELAATLGQLAGRIDQLPGPIDQMAGPMDQMAASQVRLEQRLDVFVDAADRRFAHLEHDMAIMKGMGLETRLARAPGRYVPRPLARGARLLEEDRIDQLLRALDEAPAAGVEPNGAEVVLVVEVSWLAHVDDVTRAARHSHALSRSGVDARPLVVSHTRPEDSALAAATRQQVALVSESDGLLNGWTAAA